MPVENVTSTLPVQLPVGSGPNPVQSVNANASSLLSGLLGDNPYFQAGFGLMGIGVGLTALRKGITIGADGLRRRMLVKLEINNKDPSYDWFLAWMAQQSPAITEQRPRLLSPRTWIRSHELSVQTAVEQRKNGSSSVGFRLVAGPGTHFLQFRKAWIQVKRERETRSQHLMSGIPWETVTLTTLSRDRGLFPELLAEARDIAMKSQEGKLVIHTPWGSNGSLLAYPGRNDLSIAWFSRKELRNQSSKMCQLSYNDVNGTRIEEFRTEEDISFMAHQARENHHSSKPSQVLSQRGLADDKLIHLLSNTPERSFVLIEDVDAAFNKRVQTSEDGYQSSVTFSGFLNALDGVASGEERIVFLTTNHPERLDPALIRPGRVDLSVKIDDASPQQAKNLFLRFYGEGDTQVAGWEPIGTEELMEMGNAIESVVHEQMQSGRRVSMAALQGLFIRSRAKEAVEGIRTLFIEQITSFNAQ
ncbi:hypothetical protein QCA50_003100 [Cerrena zonata]|uniref:BCS1 N-terminal domain-containing protein n=1 Tax=Cerrena zonata TaxID=2478898 RepID=A0AAW0GJI1_9APHY